MNRRWAMVVAAFFAMASTPIYSADVEPGVAHASDGVAEAMNRVGILYATGTGVPQDFTAALAWYRRAAERGSTHAMNNIATMLFHGLGAPQSYAETVKWLRLAVEQGDAAAQNKLGAMYDGGLGVPKSAQGAVELFSLAAAQGYAPGMANLGRAYANGAGVQRDEMRAYSLISAAVEIGVPRNDRDVALYELGALSQRLNAKQLERAQADARTLIDARSKASSAEQSNVRTTYRL